MPVARVRVVSVSDHGDFVVVRTEDGRTRTGTRPVGYAFQAKGDSVDVSLVERASRLESGSDVVIEYVEIAEGWNLASDVTGP